MQDEKEEKLRNTKTAAVVLCKQLQEKCDSQAGELQALREKVKRLVAEVNNFDREIHVQFSDKFWDTRLKAEPPHESPWSSLPLLRTPPAPPT